MGYLEITYLKSNEQPSEDAKTYKCESPKGANDASTFQRKLAMECICCSACIRFVECCPQEGVTEKLWIGPPSCSRIKKASLTYIISRPEAAEVVEILAEYGVERHEYGPVVNALRMNPKAWL